MKKTFLLSTASLGVLLGSAIPGMAVQRSHRPWLMVGTSSKEKTPAPPVAEKILAPAERTVRVSSAPKDKDVGVIVAHRALDYKGTRYRFGGTSKKGLDCSGLVNRVWEDLKMKKIPRASTALYHSGKPVHLAELRPGDLVFFKNTYRRGISHVGVYTGNNKFVHAASRSKGVTITKLSDPYYQLHYAGARRLY